MYVSDQQSTWYGLIDQTQTLYSKVPSLLYQKRVLVLSLKVIAKEDKQEILLSNGSDDQKTVSVFACNKGADVVESAWVLDSGRPYPYINQQNIMTSTLS